MQVVSFEVEIGGVKRIITDLKSLEDAIKETNKELRNGPKFGSEEYEKLSKQLGVLKQVQRDLNKDVRDYGRSAKAANETAVGSINEIENRLKDLRKEFRALSRAEREGDIGKSIQNQIKAASAQLKRENEKLRLETKKTERFAVGSYRAMNAELVSLRNQYKNLSDIDRNSDIGANILRNIQRLDKELKQVDASMGLFQRNVGNYRRALLGLGDIVTGGILTGGLTALVFEVRQAVEDTVRTFREFEQVITTVGAVSGATAEEMERLESLARRLGETTQFTAAQVAELELIFAKSGFNTDQIEAATESVLNFSIATQSSLENSADVITGTVRGYGLAAEETERITNVLTASFNSTKQSIDKYAEAQKFVIPIARAADIEIEALAASLGVLVDANFQGSTQGTALRRILSDLSNESSKLAKAVGFPVKSSEDLVAALKVLQSQGIDNTKAFNLVGRVAQSALITLVEGADQVDELTRSFEESGKTLEAFNAEGEKLGDFAGVAAQTAAIVGDTLEQDILKAKSAVEGLQIALVDTSEGGIRSIVQGFTAIVSAITQNLEPALAFLSRLFAPLGEALSNLGEQLGLVEVGGESLGSLLGGFLLSSINFIINAFARAIQGVSDLIEFFRTTSEESGILGNIVRQVVRELEALLIVLTNIPNLFNGIQEAVQQLGTNIANGFRNIVLEGRILFNDLKGIVDKDAAELATRLREERAKLEQGGRSVVQAFRDGFNQAAKTLEVPSPTEAEIQKAEQAQADAAKRAAAAAERERAQAEAKRIAEAAERERKEKLEAERRNANAKSANEQLRELQSALREELEELALAGEDLTSTLEEYNEVTKQIESNQTKVNAEIRAFRATTDEAKGSISILSAEVNRLKKELESNINAEGVEETVRELVNAEERLQEARNEVNRLIAAAEDPDSTGLIQTDIEDDLDKIRLVQAERIKAAQESIQQEQELANERVQINLEADIQILEQRLRLYRQGSQEFTKIETEIADKRKQLQQTTDQQNLNSRLEAIERDRLARISAIDQIGQSEEAVALQREAIELDAQRKIIAARLALEEEGNVERLQLAQELVDKELEIQQQSEESRKALQEQRIESFKGTFDFIAGNVSQLIDEVTTLFDNVTERQIDQVEERYDREIEQAEGNNEEIARLEQERDAEIEALERRAFERNKRFQIAQALISGAQAVLTAISQFGPPPSPLGIAAIAAAGLITAVQVAAISAQSFFEGGFTGKAKPGTKKDRSGAKPVGAVHEDEYVVPARVLQTPKGRKHVSILEGMRTGRNITDGNITPSESNKTGLFITGGLATAQVTPNIPNAAGQEQERIVIVESKASFTDEQVRIMADMIASRTGEKVKEGSMQATEEIAANSERRQRRNSNIN